MLEDWLQEMLEHNGDQGDRWVRWRRGGVGVWPHSWRGTEKIPSALVI